MGREEILKYVLPVFLPDTELQEDNNIYDTESEKLVVYEWKKLPVCFQSSREPKLYRNSDLSYYEIDKRTMFDAAVKNMEESCLSWISELRAKRFFIVSASQYVNGLPNLFLQ